VYPLQGSYHDAATFNDDATVNVLRLLRDVADGRLPGADAAAATAARAGVARGVSCLLRTQVRDGATRTAWGQQHDPLTHAPVDARSYEHASLASKESASIVDFLLELPDPEPPVVAAVHAAVDWFRRSAIPDLVYEYGAGPRVQPGAPAIWARMYELGTGRPLFSNRDGVRRYRYEELTDRRQGYAWYSDQPRSTLRRYERWARAHPRPATPATPAASGTPTR
jgi:PelA/Pel-15E family pectate lyase